MKGNIEERACSVANYIISNKQTVRNAAKVFNISKSTVHKDITDRLGMLDKAERHLRGGEATRKKYK